MDTPEKREDGAYRVSIEVTDEGKLELPQNLVELLQPGCLVHITVVPNELTAQEIENLEWGNLTAQQFLSGYSDADAIYDKLYG